MLIISGDFKFHCSRYYNWFDIKQWSKEYYPYQKNSAYFTKRYLL